MQTPPRAGQLCRTWRSKSGMLAVTGRRADRASFSRSCTEMTIFMILLSVFCVICMCGYMVIFKPAATSISYHFECNSREIFGLAEQHPFCTAGCWGVVARKEPKRWRFRAAKVGSGPRWGGGWDTPGKSEKSAAKKEPLNYGRGAELLRPRGAGECPESESPGRPQRQDC